MGLYVVTGGASGIGWAIVKQLEAQQHQVIVVDQKDAHIIADLATVQGRQKAISQVLPLVEDGLDGVVPCAGVGPTQSGSLILSINYFGAIALVEGLKTSLKRRKGAVVMIASSSAPMSTDTKLVELMLAGNEQKARDDTHEVPGVSCYSSSKKAICQWTRSQAKNYADDGIRLNAIAPGHVQTELTKKIEYDPNLGEVTKAFVANIPIGRPGLPEDVANMVCFMLSEKCSYMVGSIVFLDGGHDAMFRPDGF